MNGNFYNRPVKEIVTTTIKKSLSAAYDTVLDKHTGSCKGLGIAVQLKTYYQTEERSAEMRASDVCYFAQISQTITKTTRLIESDPERDVVYYGIVNDLCIATKRVLEAFEPMLRDADVSIIVMTDYRVIGYDWSITQTMSQTKN